jgi:hypothetical protein
MTKDVLVIGGGVAGLLAARRHARAGARVTLLEAAPRIGGAVGCADLAGIELNTGAEAYATRGGTVRALVDELGLSDQAVTPRQGLGSRLVSDAGSLPSPAGALLGMPGHPLAADGPHRAGPARVAAGMGRTSPATGTRARRGREHRRVRPCPDGRIASPSVWSRRSSAECTPRIRPRSSSPPSSPGWRTRSVSTESPWPPPSVRCVARPPAPGPRPPAAPVPGRAVPGPVDGRTPPCSGP